MAEYCQLQQLENHIVKFGLTNTFRTAAWKYLDISFNTISCHGIDYVGKTDHFLSRYCI